MTDKSDLKGLEKKEDKQLTARKYRMRFIFKLVLLLFLITVLLVGAALYLTYGKDILKWQQDAKETIYASTAATFRQTETSVVYDTNGKKLATLKGEKDVYYMEYEEIPAYAIDAMISIEDKKFREHPGIDVKAIVRALLAYIEHNGEITQGASTITQQLSRNIFLTHEVSWERKMKEIFIALEIENKYTKNQIMEFYLNNIYFGNGYYGIQAASKGYFNCGVEKLSLGEIAFLCAIPNNPTLYDPMDNFDNTIQRKNRIIDQMYEDGKITFEEKIDALYETITLKSKKLKKENYVETYIYHCAIKALMEKRGFVFCYYFADEEEKAEYQEAYQEMYTACQQSLYSAGYRIYTSMDMDIQSRLQGTIDKELEPFEEKNSEGIYLLQGAATAIDNETGRVVAVVGGRSQNTEGYTLNRAYQSFRQPGSSIKPLIVYAPAFEQGYTPDSIVEDAPFEGGPKNSNWKYSGKITVRSAVESSKNTIAWKLYEEMTPAVGLQYLLNMNFARIDKNDYFPATSLGGFTNGVSTVEMASAFAALEHDGIYREPTCIVKIMDSNGLTIVEEKTNSWIVYEQNAARMMTDVLQGVFSSRGTGRGLGLSEMPAAGKTGTTDDKKDGWFVGYTPYYTTSVWVGYDIPKTLGSLSGSSYPGRIWHNFMEGLHEGLAYKEFPAYEKEEIPVPENEPDKEQETKPESNENIREEDVIDDEPAIFEEEDQREPDSVYEDVEEDMDIETDEENYIDNEEGYEDEEILEEDNEEIEDAEIEDVIPDDEIVPEEGNNVSEEEISPENREVPEETAGSSENEEESEEDVIAD